jgi:hypothetical protein
LLDVLGVAQPTALLFPIIDPNGDTVSAGVLGGHLGIQVMIAFHEIGREVAVGRPTPFHRLVYPHIGAGDGGAKVIGANSVDGHCQRLAGALVVLLPDIPVLRGGEISVFAGVLEVAVVNRVDDGRVSISRNLAEHGPDTILRDAHAGVTHRPRIVGGT